MSEKFNERRPKKQQDKHKSRLKPGWKSRNGGKKKKKNINEDHNN